MKRYEHRPLIVTGCGERLFDICVPVTVTCIQLFSALHANRSNICIQIALSA